MKKNVRKLWVSRDRDGYNISEQKLTRCKDENCSCGGIYFNNSDQLLRRGTKAKLKKALYGCNVKLEMNQIKRIELTITAEVIEL